MISGADRPDRSLRPHCARCTGSYSIPPSTHTEVALSRISAAAGNPEGRSVALSFGAEGAVLRRIFGIAHALGEVRTIPKPEPVGVSSQGLL